MAPVSALDASRYPGLLIAVLELRFGISMPTLVVENDIHN